jgi:DNA-binding transcriptional ArsR family regulator
MVDHKAPDYELEETLPLLEPGQYRALFEKTRVRIADLLLERAATISELAETLGMPKGTVGHHVGVLEEAGLIRVVRTRKVRAIEAKYYGRTARTFLLGSMMKTEVQLSPDFFLTSAAAEFAAAEAFPKDQRENMMSTLRYARIPEDRAKQWLMDLGDVSQAFVAEERGGDTTYGLLVALYPTDRPHLPDPEEWE